MDIVDIENQKSKIFWGQLRIGEHMSDEKSSNEPKPGSDDPKEKFREALERKKKSGGIRNNNIAGGPKVSGGQASGNTPKMFIRKSGSA